MLHFSGRIGRQIAESKRTRKPLDEVNQFTEWENSLSSVMKAARQGDVAKVKQQLRIEGAESHYRDSNNGEILIRLNSKCFFMDIVRSGCVHPVNSSRQYLVLAL